MFAGYFFGVVCCIMSRGCFLASGRKKQAMFMFIFIFVVLVCTSIKISQDTEWNHGVCRQCNEAYVLKKQDRNAKYYECPICLNIVCK